MDTELPELTDEQRATITRFFEKNPSGGYKSACKAAGILRLTKDRARELIESDPDLSDTREKALGVDEDSAWKRLGLMASDILHKDSLRANTYILGAIHGRSESSRVEVTGAKGGPIRIEDRSASLADVAKILQDTGALDADNSR